MAFKPGRARQLPCPRQPHDRGSPVRRRRAAPRRRAPAEGADRSHRREADVVSGRDEEDASGEPGNPGRLDAIRPERPRSDQDIAAEFRLRPERPRVTRLSGRVLAGLGAVSAVVIAGALLFALRPHRGARRPLPDRHRGRAVARTAAALRTRPARRRAAGPASPRDPAAGGARPAAKVADAARRAIRRSSRAG